MNTLVLTPAYGRDYRNRKQLLLDWQANKDFFAQSPTRSGYINRVGFLENSNLADVTHLEFRYQRKYQVYILERSKA